MSNCWFRENNLKMKIVCEMGGREWTSPSSRYFLCANRLVVNAASLKPSSFGFAGSNPASRIFLVLVVQWLEQSAVNR